MKGNTELGQDKTDERPSAEADLLARSRGSGLPWGIVALAAGRPVGTAALADASHGAEPGEGPWVVGLLVAPPARRCGLGSALLSALEARAAADGWPALHATTRAEALFLRRGWAVSRRLDDGHAVLRLSLA